jgi:hypothetical protein
MTYTHRKISSSFIFSIFLGLLPDSNELMFFETYKGVIPDKFVKQASTLKISSFVNIRPEFASNTSAFPLSFWKKISVPLPPLGHIEGTAI